MLRPVAWFSLICDRRRMQRMEGRGESSRKEKGIAASQIEKKRGHKEPVRRTLRARSGRRAAQGGRDAVKKKSGKRAGGQPLF